MAGPMVSQASEALAELKAAIAEHDAAWPNGDWRAANERIGRARAVVNEILADRGLFNPRRPIGNDKAMRLLSEVIS